MRRRDMQSEVRANNYMEAKKEHYMEAKKEQKKVSYRRLRK